MYRTEIRSSGTWSGVHPLGFRYSNSASRPPKCFVTTSRRHWMTSASVPESFSGASYRWLTMTFSSWREKLYSMTQRWKR
jgi:hypothetical protein